MANRRKRSLKGFVDLPNLRSFGIGKDIKSEENKGGYTDLRKSRLISGVPIFEAGKAKLPLRSAAQAMSDGDMSKLQNNKVKVSAAKQTTPSKSTSTPKSTSSSSSSTTNTSSSTTNIQSTTSSNNMARNNKRSRSDSYDNKPSNYRFDKSQSTSSVTSFLEPPIDNSFSGKSTGSGGLIFNDAEPKVVSFNMDIKSNLLTNDFENSGVIGNETLNKFMLNGSSFSQAMLYSQNTSGIQNPDLDSTLTNIFMKYSIDVANNLNSATTGSWNKASFIGAMTTVCNALENYYTVSSIIGYNPTTMGDPSINRAMLQYKALFTGNAALMSAYRDLETALIGTWFPPNFSALIRWFFQNYKTDDIDQAQCFRYVPAVDYFIKQTDSSGNVIYDTFIGNPTQILIDIKNKLWLGSNQYNNVFAILKKVYPMGLITNLPKSCDHCVYDTRMNEIAINEPAIWTERTLNVMGYYPFSYDTLRNDLPYFMDANPSDRSGLPLALQSIPADASGTSGYTVNRMWGIRVPVPVILLNNQSFSTTNKILVTNTGTGLSSVSRHNVDFTAYTGPDPISGHNILTTRGATAGTYNVLIRSVAPIGFQRVYFDNSLVPKLSFNALMGNLFQTKA